jgi:superfamily II DNA/RNA helicase/HKD family nuclease
MKHSDLKFFTNTENDSLYERFISTIKDAKTFDVLVGYFRTSGFYRLYTELEKVENIRILIGLNTDRKSFELFEESKAQSGMDFESHKNCREIYSQTLIEEMEVTEDSLEIETAARKFVEFLKSGKLQLKVHPSRNIHAKVYIMRFKEDDRDFGRVVTGSSNFSENGLIAQREFNVELKDRLDVEFALDRFEELWAEGVDICEQYIDTIHNKTWLNDSITPYHIYLKSLYEYFKEDINIDEESDFNLPDGFMNLAYQRQAVVSAKKVLDDYNGVFLSDVVGLGKTYITALLLQKMPQGRKLIICPPVLADFWRETLHQFSILGFDIESLGKLDSILERGVDRYAYVVVDEAHRFRNEVTRGYEALHKICWNKKVILVSATPLNNKLEDIKAQIKLFQPSKKSNIPNVPNLDNFFKTQQKEIDQYDKGTAEYIEAVKRTSGRVRDRVLKHIMVRRTRTEIKNIFGDDLLKQGLRFPDMADPQRIIYQFDSKTEIVFNETMELLRLFSYSRYTPLLFLKKQLSEFDQQSQRNIGGFMKGILVKRLESSFFAFKKSLERFIRSYERFLGMYEDGTVWISAKVDVFDLLDADDEKKLESLVEEDKAHKHSSSDFRPDYKEKLLFDLQILQKISNLWKDIDSDPKLDSFIQELKNNPILKDKKVIVFSESKETVDYLQSQLDKHFGGKVVSYSSQGGVFSGQSHSGEYLREIIKANYQPKHPKPRDDLRILLTTDVLAEGISLHRSHIVINYDLPWNPIRVLQRVGRVNRVGTEHDKIYVFNIFPTAQSDAHLGLESNIKGKIQAFHNTLGEDAKYLSNDEELSSHELFGDKLYRKLNDKATFDDDQEVDSELYYLKEIRDIRDNNAELFATIKTMPKKARSARLMPEGMKQHDNKLLTFFRKGRLKKFILADTTSSTELTFLEAAKILECPADTPIEKMSQDYFPLLQTNKDFLEDITGEDDIDMSGSHGSGSSNENKIIHTIKSVLGKFKGYTDDDENYLKLVKTAIENGTIPRNTTKRIKQELQKNLNPLGILQVIRNNISYDTLHMDGKKPKEKSVREVILSEYFTGRK